MRVPLPLAVLLVPALAGCLGQGSIQEGSVPGALEGLQVTLHDALGKVLDPGAWPGGRPAALTFGVGWDGPEPSIGVTGDGSVFFQAQERTYRSKDHGRTWQRVAGPLTATSSSDPYLWVDPDTDRIFQVNMGGPEGGRGPVPGGLPASASLGLFCAHIAWSDDGGATWLANPIDCGPVPFNDHEKLVTGPWVGNGGTPAYPNAVYYAYNKATGLPVGISGAPALPADPASQDLGGYVATSFDGGMTFPQLAQSFPATCQGGLHGDPAVGPDGSVHIPARGCPAPILATSRDNGLTWTQQIVGEAVGVPEQQKNPAAAVDQGNNVHVAWTGKDNKLHLITSQDGGKTWSPPVVASAPQVGSTIWPAMVAGSAGRVGIAYVGTEDSSEPAWNVSNATRWNLYYTYTLDALDPAPTFVTLRATVPSDPVQRGTLCVQSDKCADGNRNLLDFIDIALDRDGRAYVAYADGCVTPQCLRDDATPLDSRARQGMVMVQQAGPSLLAEYGVLAPFA